MRKCLLIPIVAFVAMFAFAQASPTIELDRFFLGQGDYAVRNYLGEPQEVSKSADFTRLIYPRGKDAYVVFSILNSMPGIVYGIQITGKSAPEMNPFQGVKLGSDIKDIAKNLGAPTQVSTVKFATRDEQEQKDSQLLAYDQTNYSFIARDNKIVSIKLEGLNGYKHDTPKLHPRVWLVNAFQIPNYNFFMLCLMPNFVVHKSGMLIKIDEPFTTFVSNPDSAMYKQLVTEKDSLKNILSSYEFYDPGMRIIGKEMFLVVKGSEDNPISEIVFTVWADTFRATEITYR